MEIWEKEITKLANEILLEEMLKTPNQRLIEGLYNTGLVHTNSAFGIVIEILELQEKKEIAMPYVIRNQERGFIYAVKDVKEGLGLSLDQATTLTKMVWNNPALHSIAILEQFQNKFELLEKPANLIFKQINDKNLFNYHYCPEIAIWLRENKIGFYALPEYIKM